MKPPAASQIRRKAQQVPPGWFSRATLELEWNLSRDYAGKLIKEAVIDGRAEVKKFLVETMTRGLYPTPHYRFK